MPLTTLRLLYVDDEPDLLHLVRTALRDNPEIEVLTAESAQEALNLLEREPIDVVLSDYSMPRANGLALLSEVRRRFGDVPFILFTGRGSEEVVIEALNGRADLFIRKQGDIVTLIADLVPRLHAAVARHRSELAHARVEARFHAIFEHTDRGLILTDGAGRVTEANTASRAYLGLNDEKCALDELAGRLAPEGRRRFMDLVTMARNAAIPARDWFTLSNGSLTPVEITLKRIAPDQLLLVIEEVEEKEALEAQNREVEKTLDLLSSSLRQQVERSTLVVRGLTDQLSRNVTDRRDLALIERITIANEEIRSTVAFALRHQGHSDEPVRFRPLLPIVRQAARAAGIARDRYVVDLPDISVSSDAWLERVLHQLLSEAIRTGAEDLRLSATVDQNGRLSIGYRETSGAGMNGEIGHENERLSILQEILDDCPVTIDEQKIPGGSLFELHVPVGSYRYDNTE